MPCTLYSSPGWESYFANNRLLYILYTHPVWAQPHLQNRLSCESCSQISLTLSLVQGCEWSSGWDVCCLSVMYSMWWSCHLCLGGIAHQWETIGHDHEFISANRFTGQVSSTVLSHRYLKVISFEPHPLLGQVYVYTRGLTDSRLLEITLIKLWKLYTFSFGHNTVER